MKRSCILSLIVFCFCSFAHAQNTLVSSGAFFEGEPYLAIDPTNPQHLVAAWMGLQLNEKIVIKSARSTDGGLTWSAPIWQAHQQAGNSSADVSMAFDAQGILYMAYIDYDNVNFTNGAVVCRKSVNAGQSWGAATIARSISSCPNKLCIDRPWIAVDPLTGSVVITSTNAKQPGIVQAPFHPYLAVSSDQGATFSLQELDAPPYLAGNAISQPLPSPAFSNNGTFMALYPSYDPTQSILPRIVEVSKTAVASFYTYQIAFQGLGFGTTNDSLKIGPHLALDPSNSNHAVYTFATEVFGDPDIALIERNNGVWSAPQRVNNDAQANGALQDLAWADFDSDGDYAVCWRDRRNGLANTYSSPTEIVCRIKSQGTWSNELFISPQISHDSILLESGNDFLNVQFHENKLYTIWGDVRSGSLKIYLNVFDQLDSTNMVSEIPTLPKVFPNPSNGLFEIPPHLTQQYFELLDAKGTLILNGTLSERLDLSLFPSGMYWLNVAESQFQLHKN
ncbi:MAG: T9SS type A sorting domain-containing protein [Flavobacteriales bacterium]